MRYPSLLLLIFLLVFTASTAAAKDKKRADNQPQYDGIDISRHNGDVNWKQIADNPCIKYVYIKATEGRKYSRVDYFHQNQRQARKMGVKVGAYHYMVTSSPVQKQFDHFREVVKPSEIDLIPMIDYEVESGDWTPQQARDSIKAFADLIEKYYGCRPIIYTYVSLYNTQLGMAFKNYPIFIASYDKAPVMQSGRWTIHQFTETGRVPGIRGNVDLSRFNDGCSLNDILYHRAAKKSVKHKNKRRTKAKAKKATKANKANKANKATKANKTAKVAKAAKAGKPVGKKPKSSPAKTKKTKKQKR